jgi:trehalose-6-phosphate synthase
MRLAIDMEPDERERRMKSMRAKVLDHDVHHWARSALAATPSNAAE